MIDDRRCEVKKALTKSEMQSLKSMSGGAPADPAAAMNAQMGGVNQNYGVGGNMPYGMPPGNMGYQQGNTPGWLQGPYNSDANAAAGNYGYGGDMNAQCGHMCNMGFGNVAGMLGSMLATLGAQGGNMASMAGAGPGLDGGNMGQGPGNVAG